MGGRPLFADDADTLKPLLDQACKITLQAKECDDRILHNSAGDDVGSVKIAFMCTDSGKPLCEECNEMGAIVVPCNCDGDDNGN